MKLVIVESPKKAELISGFLKKHHLNDYKVMASAGHVRDLKQHSFSVNVEDHFRPEYVINDDKKNLVRELKAEAKKAKAEKPRKPISSTLPPMKTVRERLLLGI